MIPHSYTHTAPDTVQAEADACERQEITIEFYNTHLPGEHCWRYLPDQSEYGLDPWRLTDDPNYSFRPDRGERLFAQRKDLAAAGLAVGEPGNALPPTVIATHDLSNDWTLTSMSNGSAILKGPGHYAVLSASQLDKLRQAIAP